MPNDLKSMKKAGGAPASQGGTQPAMSTQYEKGGQLAKGVYGLGYTKEAEKAFYEQAKKA